MSIITPTRKARAFARIDEGGCFRDLRAEVPKE